MGKKKKIETIVEVGICKYCKKKLLNTDSFVSFYGGGHAHYDCMKENDEKRNKSKFDW